ncbi:methyltransferase OMS1, mitochondrial [Achaetomium macrosporum]|uniref:Methyltransferase OMS1, mitochondrial n=1 Tax=Achaetomium macrosporum TaxID=79813 RepID=A0AAN7CIM1_9PEZI|nr:methyltransferase OMS1, mitochondrial [Achaetomium macrosporum]
MASRFRMPRRVQLPPQLSSPSSSSYSRNFTLSSRRYQPSKRAARPPPSQTISLRTQSKTMPPPSTPKSPSSSSSDAQSLDVLVQQRKWPLFGAGLLALGMGIYISLVLTSTLKKDKQQQQQITTTPLPLSDPMPSDPSLQPPPTGLPAKLDTSTPATAHTTARAFDKSLDWPEWLGGITALRRELAARARGHVLEVAVGTGRNLAHYDWSEVVSLSQDEDEARAQRERERLVRLLDARRLGGPTLREQQQARGGVGEVGSLEGEVLSFTGVDVSGDMMDVARDRIRESVPGLKRIMRKRRVEAMPNLSALGVDAVGEEGLPVVEALDGRVRLVLGDALRGLPSPPPVGPKKGAAERPATKYDTIIETFGLCSVADPARLLANMAAKVQPDTGRIILLEHGRGFYDWMNKRLDKDATAHFQKYGCWWNRDIEQLVRDAAQTVPGLEVVKLERPGWFQWGTTLLIELKVKSQQNGGGGGKA